MALRNLYQGKNTFVWQLVSKSYASAKLPGQTPVLKMYSYYNMVLSDLRDEIDEHSLDLHQPAL